MKLSLQEIREENLFKADTSVPLPTITQAIVKYTPKLPPLRDGACHKHGALHNQAAKLGIQKTRAKRWRSMDDHYSQSGFYISAKDHHALETAHHQARMAFHREPCTCSATGQSRS